MDLQGSQVVIIGGSSGMGLATARLAKECGATVTIASRSSEKLQHAAHQLGDVRAVVADMTIESDVGSIFRDLDHVDQADVMSPLPPETAEKLADSTRNFLFAGHAQNTE